MDFSEEQLIGEALRVLEARLPPRWEVERVQGQGAESGEGDARFSFKSESGMGQGSAIVEARTSFAPADVDRLLGGLTRRLRDASGLRPILLVSNFLSPRTQELLAAEDISYLDLTGNIRLVMEYPPIFVETSGASRRSATNVPNPPAGLAGAKVGRMVRFLAEVRPPYGVIDIEDATGLSRGYVSRVLGGLSDEALIQRKPRGPVEVVDWPALLRARGRSVDVFKANATQTYVAPNGARALFETLSGSKIADKIVVTGSFAAVRKAPVAAPALLAIYLRPSAGVPRFDEVEHALGLLATDEAADVAVMISANDRVVEDTWGEDDAGIPFVNLPQLVVDCLGGSGRMPAEGEALLEWMSANTEEWQYPSLEAFQERRR